MDGHPEGLGLGPSAKPQIIFWLFRPFDFIKGLPYKIQKIICRFNVVMGEVYHIDYICEMSSRIALGTAQRRYVDPVRRKGGDEGGKNEESKH